MSVIESLVYQRDTHLDIIIIITIIIIFDI